VRARRSSGTGPGKGGAAAETSGAGPRKEDLSIVRLVSTPWGKLPRSAAQVLRNELKQGRPMRVEALPEPCELQPVPEHKQSLPETPAIADGVLAVNSTLVVSSSSSSQPDAVSTSVAGAAEGSGSSDGDAEASGQFGDGTRRVWKRGATPAKQEAIPRRQTAPCNATELSETDMEKDETSSEPQEESKAGGPHDKKMKSIKARLRKAYTETVTNNTSLVNEHDINAALAMRPRKKKATSLKSGIEPGGEEEEKDRGQDEDDGEEEAGPLRRQRFEEEQHQQQQPAGLQPQHQQRGQQRQQKRPSTAQHGGALRLAEPQGVAPSSARAGKGQRSGFAGIVSAAAATEKTSSTKAAGSGGATSSSPEPAWKVVKFANTKGPPLPPWSLRANAGAGGCNAPGGCGAGADARERGSSCTSSLHGDSSASGGETDEPREPGGERLGSARKSFLRGFVLGKQAQTHPHLALENGASEGVRHRGSITRKPEERDPHSCPMPFEVIDWSSQRDDSRHAATNLAHGPAGSMWETGGPPEQWLIIDFRRQVEVCSMQLRCTGLQMDPKDILLYRCGAEDPPDAFASNSRPHLQSNAGSSEHASGAPDGPWIIVRRFLVQAGPQSRGDRSVHNVPVDASCRARYWRLVIKDSWGGNRRVRILAPLVFYGEWDSKPKTALQSVVEQEMHKQPSLTTMFSEVVNLSKEEREMRMIARKHRIPLDLAEKVREEFRRFDTEQTGSLGYQQFVSIVRLVAGSKQTSPSPMRTLDKIPETRIRHLWQNVDCDGSGRIELEEFLVWFHRTFQVNMHEAESSKHSERKADTVTEQYYASLGSQRLRYMTQRAQAAQQGTVV